MTNKFVPLGTRLPAIVFALTFGSLSPYALAETVTVKRGDSLSKIAEEYLGNERKWRELCDLNHDALGGRCDLLKPGSSIELPSTATSAASEDVATPEEADTDAVSDGDDTEVTQTPAADSDMMDGAPHEVTITIAGEAYDGPPAFSVSLGEVEIGNGVVKSAIETETGQKISKIDDASEYADTFTFDVPDADFDAKAPLRIVLTNDKSGGADNPSLDRNLFVLSFFVNGQEQKLSRFVLERTDRTDNITDDALYAPIYSGSQTLRAAPPEDGWPSS